MGRTNRKTMDDLKASDVMDKRIISVHRTESLMDILGKMRKYDKFDLPVTDDGHLLGMISYSQLAKRKNIPLYTHAEHIMYQPAEVSEDTSVADIAHLFMANHTKALPIIKKGKIAGIVTREGVCSMVPDSTEYAHIPIKEVMTREPMTIDEDDDLGRARHIMKGLDERFVPVVDKRGELTGVIGSREIVEHWKNAGKKRQSWVTGEKRPVHIVIKSIMRSPVTATESTEVGEAITAMMKKNVPSVVVVRDRRPVGILTLFDVIGLITKSQEREGVFVEIVGLEEEEHDLTEIMYETIEKYMSKIGKMVKPSALSIHVTLHHHEGGETKYTIKAKMNTDHKMFYTSSFDWNLLKVLDEVMEQLERMVRKEKERRLEKSRTKRKK